jgi:hypothetical protein
LTGRPLLLLASVALAAAPSPARAAGAKLLAAFDDDPRDATGPGGYRRPGDSELVDGDFDLRRLEVWEDGDHVIFKVSLGAPFRAPAVSARTTATPLPLWNNLYFQNIDIYLDTDPAPGAGHGACIPGRRVAFAHGRTWEAAVVLTPQPGPAEDVTRAALGEAGRRVFFPRDLQTQGRTVIARVPVAALGGPPRSSWGYSVHVSGARWERSFAAAARVAGSRPEPDAFTMPVIPIREAWAFGGAPAGEAHPRVVDVLLPRGADQKAVLGSFDAATGAYARVPFVSLAGPAAARHPAPSLPQLRIVDVSGSTVTIEGELTGLEPMMIGKVLGTDGVAAARVVVTRLLPGGLVAEVLEGQGPITRGARVVFDAQPPRSQPFPR